MEVEWKKAVKANKDLAYVYHKMYQEQILKDEEEKREAQRQLKNRKNLTPEPPVVQKLHDKSVDCPNNAMKHLQQENRWMRQ